MTRPTDHACHEQNQWGMPFPDPRNHFEEIKNALWEEEQMKSLDTMDPATACLNAVLDVIRAGIDEIDYSEWRIRLTDLTSYSEAEQKKAALLLLGSPDEKDRALADWFLGRDA